MSNKKQACVARAVGVFFLLIAFPATAANLRIRVHGLTGEIEKDFDIARPGDDVTVEVCPADLINYGYTIERGPEELLREGFPIVGVGTVFEGTSGAADAALAPPERELASLADRDLVERFRNLRVSLQLKRDEVVTEVGRVESAAKSRLFDRDIACRDWPSAITDLAGAGASRPPFLVIHDRLIRDTVDLERSLQALSAEITDRELNAHLGGATLPAVLDALKREIQALAGVPTAMKTSLASARDTVERWSSILSKYREPILSQVFPMTQTSSRQTITVKRQPMTKIAQLELPEGTDTTKIQLSAFKSVSFLNRAFHRFNVSLGMVGTWREDERAFSVVADLGEASTPTFKVRETSRDELKLDAAAFLGIYLRPGGIDHYSPDRGRAYMLMLGSEVSTSPKQFFLGLGLDSPKGVVMGIGITEYQGVSPAPGWDPPRQVPAGTDGKPVVATVPTVQEDTLGAYAFVGFRPSIFKAFLDRRKP